MPITNSKPVRITPRTASDTVDGTNSAPGAMIALTNLVQDPSTMGLFVPRPASVELTDFSTSGLTTPGFISCIFVVGTRVYGMIATADFAGKDMPFIYDIAAGAFVTVTSIAVGELPTSPATTGTWTPPTMAVVGTKVIVTHPGFSGANKIGWFDISTFAVPTWNAGDTTTNALPAKPTFVFNFFDRAYYVVGNTLWFSDILAPDRKSVV